MSALRRDAAAFTPSPALSQLAPPGSRPQIQPSDDGGTYSLATRARTCLALTPQFHWNLNAHAVESLADDELTQVYRLFRFYDSSTVGDSLPSISYRRLLQLLNDGGLISSQSESVTSRGPLTVTIDEEPESVRLDVTAVEKIFAEAVVGKLRTYFDADGQPVLTFHLFCGALLNCAMTVFFKHKLQPEVAMSKLLEKLLTAVEHYANERQRELRRPSSLLQHFPSEGPSAVWLPGEAHGAVALMPSSRANAGGDSDFRILKPFQQVLSSFSVDVAIETSARERSQQEYAIPADLVAHFTTANLAIVVDRFRLFDVFDRGTLPRHEILPLLTGLAKKLEISDMYEVLTLLLTGEHGSRYGRGSALSSDNSTTTAVSTAEISLTEVLRAIQACRRSRIASPYGSHTATVRKTTHQPLVQSGAELRGDADIQSTLPTPVESNREVEDNGDTDRLTEGELSDNKRASKDRKPPRRSKVGGSQQVTSTKHSAGARNGSTSTDKKSSIPTKRTTAELCRKPSALPKDPSMDGTGEKARRSSRRNSKANGTSADSESTDSGDSTNATGLVAMPRLTEDQRDSIGCDEPVIGLMDRRDSFNLLSDASASHSIAFPDKPRITMVPSTRMDGASDMKTPVNGAKGIKRSSTSESRARSVQVFMLLGGDHDGAICYAVKLTLPQRKLEETRGVFYRNASHEVLERSPVLPVQPDVESALLMLRRSVQQRLNEGFTLYPGDQLTRVDVMLAEARQSNPHYQSPLRGLHHDDDSGCSFRVTSLNSTTSTPNRVGLSTRKRDFLATSVRQASTPDLLGGLSDVFTTQSVSDKNGESMSRGSDSTSHRRAARRQPRDATQATSRETRDDDLSWIHAVNDANRTRSMQRLQSSVSMPLLRSSSSQQTWGLKLQKSQLNHRVQLQPIQ